MERLPAISFDGSRGSQKSICIYRVWAVFHYPFYMNGYNEAGNVWINIGLFTVTLVPLSIVMGWIRMKSQSLWPVVIFHGMVNHQRVFWEQVFYVKTDGWGYIAGETGVISLVIWSILAMIIRRVSVADLFRDAVKEEKQPTFSIWLVILSVICIGTAYDLAWNVKVSGLMSKMLPILILTLVGTYLGFTQLSVAAISCCEKLPSFYYRGKNLFLLSQLRFRLKDHARILFMVSILSSIVMTSVAVSCTYYVEAERAAEEQAPFHLNWQEPLKAFSSKEIEQMMQTYHLSVKNEVHLPLIKAEWDSWVNKGMSTIHLVSGSDFNKLLQNSTNLPPLQLHKGEVVLANSGGGWKEGVKKGPGQTVTVQVGKQSFKAELSQTVQGILFNESDTTRHLLVVEDSIFKELAAVSPKSEQVTVHGYRFTDWKQSGPMLNELKEQLKQRDENDKLVNGTFLVCQFLKSLFAPLMFVSMFVGILFFLSSGSILYFKLFTDLPHDRRQMTVLSELGIQEKEAVSILKWQICLLFFIPFGVGIIHSAVALKMFSFLFKTPVWGIFAVIATIYLAVFGLYYVWTSKGYTKSVLTRTGATK
ncbi:CPBP family intramembrane glutamic endopeptidase [Paenactinomyces guangxiensis]|uniref:CPBP family intramembrane metalloprotease n=1 Tax=Paenactinomyces guangxiensis TaxID=1490290 RepID=A0A7W1WPR6_9BACL|nr:CPBP family intramembrane glutamic endopeptidase [Paenactinomyces guangxiensis]MBA4493663.1 CPBP family intramembrane metalloprotease [Paenactinomyces guangxiensis]MBH8590950.1 CPBP family intramembrane metalloprotease [Paenactinomyces guangxiensis]